MTPGEPVGHALEGRTIVMSGGSRGIGLVILRAAAEQGANAVLLAKTDEPDPRLPGTVHTAVAEIEAAGGRAVAVVGDVRSEDDCARAAELAVAEFGGIDVVVNNASAINIAPTEHLPMKAYDLMQDINCRGAFLLSKLAIDHLRKSDNPHILTLSPPISTDPKWFGPIGTGYTIAKYGMSLVALGLAGELASDGIAANALWPRTTIDTAAIRNIVGAELASTSRTPQIMADAAHAIVTKPAKEVTGQFFIDDEVLAAEGVTDFSPYRLCESEADLSPDFWVEPRS
jgi:citronellol/citronellal dehydrogenase